MNSRGLQSRGQQELSLKPPLTPSPEGPEATHPGDWLGPGKRMLRTCAMLGAYGMSWPMFTLCEKPVGLFHQPRWGQSDLAAETTVTQFHKHGLDTVAGECSMCHQQSKCCSLLFVAQSSGDQLIILDTNHPSEKTKAQSINFLARIMRMVNNEFELKPNVFVNWPFFATLHYPWIWQRWLI